MCLNSVTHKATVVSADTEVDLRVAADEEQELRDVFSDIIACVQEVATHIIASTVTYWPCS